MNITIARPRCTRPVYAVVSDGPNKSKFLDWPISIVTQRGAGNDRGVEYQGESLEIVGESCTILIHFYEGDSHDVIGTIVLPAERLRRLSNSETQKIWMVIGDKFINERPTRAEANKYFDRLIRDSEDESSEAIRLPVLFSNDFKWIKDLTEASPVDRPRRLSSGFRRTSSDTFRHYGESTAADPSSPQTLARMVDETEASASRQHVVAKTVYRARNQSIARYSEFSQGVTALLCFHAWVAHTLDEKHALQVDQLARELKEKQDELETQEKQHAERIRRAVSRATGRHTELLALWKDRILATFAQDEGRWIRDMFMSWRRESSMDVNSHHGAIVRRWVLLVEMVCQAATKNGSIVSRLKRFAAKFSQPNLQVALMVQVSFRSWASLCARRQRIICGIDVFSSTHLRKTNAMQARHCLSAWRRALQAAREAKELEKEREAIGLARQRRVESIRRIFAQRDESLVAHGFTAWCSATKDLKIVKTTESANESRDAARREVERAMVDNQALADRLASVEREMKAAQQMFESTIEFRDQQYKLLHDAYQDEQKQLQLLKTADAALEDLRRTSTSDALLLQNNIDELSAALKDANLEKAIALTTASEIEAELENVLKEDAAQRLLMKDLEKRLDRQKRQHMLFKQESKNNLAEKDLQIAKLNCLREKETMSAQQRLHKGVIQSRTLQKKLVAVSNNELQVARLETLDTVKTQLERKIAVLEKERRRTVQINMHKSREVGSMRQEYDAMKALLERTMSKPTRKALPTPPRAKIRRKIEEMSPKEEEEYETLKEHMKILEHENEVLAFECGREEIMQKFKVQEMEMMQAELKKE
eukprot:GEMP01011693.1.p1 GENE.GEMP01011693.1~~GEMP01011693.1.p1  ORF type:complete len:826 (+),score=164.89 GEMP01011693.1:28-2505(+)